MYDIVTSKCFVEGTLVVTEDGDKPIEEIKAGDFVYSTNPETGESEYKEVIRTFRKESDVLIHIFVNGEEIETTPVHPFWVVDEWVSAKDLEAGDILTLADGTTASVTDTYGEQLDAPVIVYNFEVSDFHTYYVTETGVLVHNTKKCFETNSTSDNKSQKSTKTRDRDKYMGKTPSKRSKTGSQVIERMKGEGRIRDNNGVIEFMDSKEQWHPLKDADMAHKTDAVTWWNVYGKKTGAKSSEVRAFMLNPDNYYLEYYSINRSQGAQLRVTYDPPEVP